MRTANIVCLVSWVALVACSSSSSELSPNEVVMQPSVSQENLGCGALSQGGLAPGQACTADSDCAWTCCACVRAPLAAVMTADCSGEKLDGVLRTSFSSRQCVNGACADRNAACDIGTRTFHMCRCTGTGQI